ncbi:hypothetical protein OK074_4656 [Actinobacteria bacterium OK074]|nr:hypothetical protein OK074_4656 [Actinobacteria bacterium OK074]
MRKHIFGKTAVATVLAAGAALGTFAAAGTAQASPDFGCIEGKGVTTNDWGNESLDNGSTSNAVRLWQYVLYADNAKYVDEDGDLQPFTLKQVKGTYNKVTRSATKFWQQKHGVDPANGRAEEDSFSTADDSLDPENTGTREVVYDGSKRDVTFKRIPIQNTGKSCYAIPVGAGYQLATY